VSRAEARLSCSSAKADLSALVVRCRPNWRKAEGRRSLGGLGQVRTPGLSVALDTGTSSQPRRRRPLATQSSAEPAVARSTHGATKRSEPCRTHRVEERMLKPHTHQRSTDRRYRPGGRLVGADGLSLGSANRDSDPKLLQIRTPKKRCAPANVVQRSTGLGWDAQSLDCPEKDAVPEADRTHDLVLAARDKPTT
jgi:hypothetical protein